MISILITLALSSISAQDSSGCITYLPCLKENDIYVSSTCQPMTNATMSAVCMCYANVNRNLCFLQCPNDETVQTAASAFQSTLVSSCSAVNLNPKALPPAPWVTYQPTTLVKTTSTSQSAPTSQVTQVPTAQQSSGTPVPNIGIAFVAVIAMFFAI